MQRLCVGWEYPETDTKPKQSHIFVITFILKHETAEAESQKEGLHPQYQAFLQSMTSTLSTQRLWIFYWTGFT